MNQPPIADVAVHFDAGFGRPTKDLHIAIGALILEQLHDLTDQQTVEAVAFNIAWHYALDIHHDVDTYLCPRTLRNYRRKIIEKQLETVVFRSLTDQLVKAFGVDTSKQRLDLSVVQSAIRNLTRLGILVEAVRKFLRELKRRCPDLHREAPLAMVVKYVDRQGDSCFADTRPNESKRRLPEAAQDVWELLEQFRLTNASELHNFQLLSRIFHEQCQSTENAQEVAVGVRLPRVSDCSTILSPADPDASYNKHRGIGYTVQIMETFAEDDAPSAEKSTPSKPDFITHVAVGKMNIHDQAALEPALEDVAKRGIKPEELLADSYYGSNESLEKGRTYSVQIVSPSMPAKGRSKENCPWKIVNSTRTGEWFVIRKVIRPSKRASLKFDYNWLC